MNFKRLPFLLPLLLAMLLFHQCSEEDFLEPVSSQPKMKELRVEDDENLISALEEIFASDAVARKREDIQYESEHVIMIRDEDYNVVRYSLALENGNNPGIKNLVVTLTPKREVFAHILSYVPDDPDQLFFGMEDFTGQMIISDLEGNEINRSYLVNGQSPEAKETPTNGKTAGSECVTTYHYTESHVYIPGHSAPTINKRLDYIKVSCYETGGGGSGSPDDSGDGELGGGGGGTGGSSVAINRVLSTVSKNTDLPSNPYNGQTVYVRNGDGSVTALVYIKDLDGWLMPELVHIYYSNEAEFSNNNGAPKFDGAVLGTMAFIAIAEPTPIGEIIWIGAATFYVAVHAVDLAKYYLYTPPPTNLPGFPGARRVRPKAGVKRWIDTNGDILEWDGFHDGGEVEVYDRRGKHKGAFDPDTGQQIKPRVPGRTTPRE